MDTTAQSNSPTQGGSQQPASSTPANAPPPQSNVPTTPIQSDSSPTPPTNPPSATGSGPVNTVNGGEENNPPRRNFRKIGFYLVLFLVIVTVAIFAYQSTKTDSTIQESQNTSLVSEDQNLQQPETQRSVASLQSDPYEPSEDVVCARFTNLIKAIEFSDEACFLDLSNQNLTEVPEEIYTLPNLREIDLSNNNLTTISQELIDIPGVTSIILSGNNISSITGVKNKREPAQSNDSSALPFTALQSLDLSGNNISEEDQQTLDGIFNYTNSGTKYFIVTF